MTAATADLKLLAELSDHDLRIAPASVMSSAVSIRDWIRSNSGIETDGLIVDPEVAADAGVAEVLASVRRERPRMPIDLGRDYSISSEADLSLRVARMILGRLGESFRILPFYTEAGNRSFRQVISRMIGRVDSYEVMPGGGSGVPPDLLLFVVLPGTTPAGHQRLMDGLRQTIGGSSRVALAELTTDKGSKDRLFANLRKERWVDRLAGLASSDPASLRNDEDAAARTLAQSVLFLAGIRSMRDDFNRLHRIELARVRLLFTRCLQDYGYPLIVRPTLGPMAGELGLADFERLVLARLQPLASEIFNEQFRRNIHSTRLVTGEWARFEIGLLQQLRLRPPVIVSGNVSPGIRVSIHLAPLMQPGNLPQTGAVWEISNAELDQRLRDRWREVPWERFATGTARVAVSFHDNQGRAVDSPDGYRLRSRVNRTTRRIDIFATTDRGRGYAINHLARLGARGELERDLDLAESPHFTVRGIVDNRGGEWSLRERLDLIKLLGRLRMNRYLLVLPPGATAISAESVLQIERAAAISFVELEVIAKLPLHTRPLAPEDAVPCFASVRDPAISTPLEMNGAVLIQAFGPPYSAWLRLASLAELAWSPGGYRPERGAEYLLAGEEPETIERWRQLLPNATDCQPGQPLTLTPPAANLIPRNGRRVLSLLRGELREISRQLSSRR